LYLASVATAHAAANADNIYVQFAGAVQQGLFSAENAAPSDRLEVNMKHIKGSFGEGTIWKMSPSG
jgi:hypothetical protein